LWLSKVTPQTQRISDDGNFARQLFAAGMNSPDLPVTAVFVKGASRDLR
jgi:hypothetical protein